MSEEELAHNIGDVCRFMDAPQLANRSVTSKRCLGRSYQFQLWIRFLKSFYNFYFSKVLIQSFSRKFNLNRLMDFLNAPLKNSSDLNFYKTAVADPVAEVSCAAVVLLSWRDSPLLQHLPRHLGPSCLDHLLM